MPTNLLYRIKCIEGRKPLGAVKIADNKDLNTTFTDLAADDIAKIPSMHPVALAVRKLFRCPSKNRLVLERSTDGGRTWTGSDIRVFLEDDALLCMRLRDWVVTRKDRYGFHEVEGGSDGPEGA